MVKKLIYKEWVMILKSPVFMYSIIFLLFSLTLSFKIESMRYTGIMFMIYITFLSITKYEEKYSGFLMMNTLPVEMKEIAKAKYSFLSGVLFSSTGIMYLYKIFTEFSFNLVFEVIIVLIIGTIYVTVIYNSYYKSEFKQVQTKLMILAITMNVICSVIVTLLPLFKINMIFSLVGGVLLLFIWHVGKEINMRLIEKVKV